MIQRIPQRVDHLRYTDQGVILDGLMTKSESDKDLLRFKEAIVESCSDIIYHLEFDIDFSGNRYVTGNISTQVVLQCQRCMHDMHVDINCNVFTAFVQNEAQQKLAEDLNFDIFWLAKKEYLDPRILIEDELLLALPQIAVHPLSEVGNNCQAEVVFLDADSEHEKNHDEDNYTAEQIDNNPFAVLKQLKTKK